MKQVDITTRTIPNRPRNDSYPIGSTVAIGAGGGSSTIINNGGGIDLAEARRHFLSKTSADAASGIIAFLQGLRLGSDLVDKLSKENTEGELTDTSVMSALRVLKEIANNNDELKKIFLRKDQEDTTNFLQKFLGGLISTHLQSPDFLSGAMGHGFTLRQNEDGTTYAEVDKLLVRMKAIFQSLEIMKTELAGASFMFNASGARMRIVKTEQFNHQPAEFADGSQAVFADGSRAVFAGAGEPFIRCWFVADDGETAIENRFRVGNLVRSQTFNIKTGAYEGVSNRFWWREVIGVGDDYIDIAIARCAEGSDLPAEGDVCVQLGDLKDIDYQSAVVLSAYGEGAPYITMYQGINSYSLADKDVFTIGYDRVKHECFLANYGRAYVGARDKTQYLEYRDGKLKVSADEIKLGGKDVNVSISDLDKKISLKVDASQVEDMIIDKARITHKILDATALDENKYYPITFNLWTGSPKVRISLVRTLDESFGVPSYASHAGGFDVRCVWTTNADGWGTADLQRNIEYYSLRWVNPGELVVGDIGQMNYSSNEYIYVRGGSKYKVIVEGEINTSIILHTDTYTVNEQTLYVKDMINNIPVPSLEETGIDIYNRTVKVTADNFFVSSTGGTPIAVFTTKNGKPVLKAEHIDVDDLKVKHLDGADGTFSGSLNAISGTFRSIQSEADPSSYRQSMNINSTRIRFTDYQTTAMFGTSTTSYASGSTAVANVELKGNVGSAGYIGMCISVTGNNYPGDLYRGNFALYIPKGQIRGFRPGARRVASNTTLSVMDTIVIVIAGDITVTLPDRPEDGQMYIIRNASNRFIYIKSNKQNIKAYGDINMKTNQIHNETGQTNIIFYDAINDVWFPGYTNRW